MSTQDPIVISQSGWRVETFEGKQAVCRKADGSRISPGELLDELGEASAQRKRWEEIEGGLKKVLLDYAEEKNVTQIATHSNWTASIITSERKTQDLDKIGLELQCLYGCAVSPPHFVDEVIRAAKGWNTAKFPWMAEEDYSIPHTVRAVYMRTRPKVAPGKIAVATKE